ncbi:FAD-dependent oxidoreductase [Nocardioides gansuensis]|uniref:FAD-dependent oxidoreductase n=1 Tax=Nocardioides gansuensis TaxID=2138300 RepID=A0A2T8FF08_9ACTN|nr:FAD-dependent oxidoreductase [Nocardioides gansuensis]PVG84293.1 FAD-dependent oxidoreductase [Nocardioides gansuensis]
MSMVIVGGGLAAANAAKELRDRDYPGPVTVVAAESHLPYERPPLSKGILLGKAGPDDAVVNPQEWYAEQEVDLRTGTRAESVDLEARTVTLAGGEQLSYERLLLATGATPRTLSSFEASSLPVTTLRTLEDSLALKERLDRDLLIVGAGWIGLEVASAAVQAGGRVTIVDPAAQPLLAALGPEVGALFAELHRGHGVDLRLETSVEAAAGDLVRLSDGHELSPDLVVVGIGAVPDDSLARDAGLDVDGGVLVDASLRTSDPHVLAAGDVAVHDHPVLGRRIRVEHWDTAIHQGRHAARVMLGDEAPYDRQPYFYTDQYDMGMEYVGSVGPDGYDDVEISGSGLVEGLQVVWKRGGTVVAVMQANDWDAMDSLRARLGGA